ncbi:hypothetical protein EMCRGX_G020707 [Ephydatia muelleri]
MRGEPSLYRPVSANEQLCCPRNDMALLSPEYSPLIAGTTSCNFNCNKPLEHSVGPGHHTLRENAGHTKIIICKPKAILQPTTCVLFQGVYSVTGPHQ